MLELNSSAFVSASEALTKIEQACLLVQPKAVEGELVRQLNEGLSYNQKEWK